MGGKHRRSTASPIALLLAWMLGFVFEAPAAASPATIAPWTVCDGPPWLPSRNCTRTPFRDIDPQGRILWLSAEVRLRRDNIQPAALFISAYASSAAYWNGKLIGLNGVPSEHPDLEKPGLRDAAFPIPPSHAGVHRLTLAMSSHNGLLRLRSPVTQLSVEAFEPTSSKLMRGYLPALMSAGALLIMAAVFAFRSWGSEPKSGGAYLFGAALCATGQLGAEASRAFLELPYPMLFLRILLVLAFASGFAFMLLAYFARRFELERLWPVLLAQALFASTAILVVPSFDQKTGCVITSAVAMGMLLAVRAATRSMPGALPLVLMLSLGLFLSLAEPHSFLNRDLYLWTAALFLLLFVGESRRPSHSSVAEDQIALRASRPEAPAAISLGTAAARRFVLPSDIVRLAAADDYTEVFLIDRRAVLHPQPLEKLLERLPSQFVRVHRSHAINLAYLRSFNKGRVSTVRLTDDSVAPVSRRSVAKLVAALEA